MKQGIASRTENAEGQLAEFHASVLRKLPRDMDSETRQKWINDPQALGKALHEALVPFQKTLSGFVEVDYEVALSESIRRCKLDTVSPGVISANFPPSAVSGKVKYEYRLVLYEAGASGTLIAKEQAKDGFGSARIRHLLAFASKQKRLEECVMAIGDDIQYVSDNVLVPCFKIANGSRCLSLIWVPCHQPARSYLMFVRKVS
ncbi:MAG: hypothetical protein KGI60_01060 [Patescibacteria group bacterium]|nr:hypothetical protein [Patescibacteria group bacterium]